VNKWGCPWCERKFAMLEKLAAHVLFAHDTGKSDTYEMTALRAVDDRRLHRYRIGGGLWRVRCICNEPFTCASVVVAPLFEEWAVENIEVRESNSFVAHLRREGGLENHLQKLRDEAMMAKIAGCVDG
jgi:hypothetical protein